MADARPRKHSLTLHGHRTSVSLEEPFWRAFLRIAEAEGKTINGLAAEIDDARLGRSGLATAIRLYVLAWVQGQLSEQGASPPPPAGVEAGQENTPGECFPR